MRTIIIKGMGRVSVKPDLIVVSMELETKDKDYEQTMALASQKIDSLNKSLEGIGFEKNSIKTTNFDIIIDYESVKKDGQYQQVFCGYKCNHNLKVEFDFDTKRLAEVLNEISKCVAKPEFSISFTVRDKEVVSRELLKSATQNAREKAEILCSASGVKLGDLLSIDYNWGELNICSNTNYSVSRNCKMETLACFSSVEIQPENIDLNDTVTFVWEII